MFGFGLPTSYFSAVNFDMTNGNAWSSMNLHANQNWADLIARQSLYQVPMYNFTGFTQYPSTFGMNNYLCDPMWTIGQMQAANLANGGQGIFPGMQFPWTQGSQSSSSSSKTDAEKEEEARMKEEYNALKELLTTYKNTNKNIATSLKSKIDTALKKSGKIEEKLEALQNAYDAIPKNSLRKAMALMDTKETGYRQALEAAGYKFGVSEYSFNSGKERDINNRITELENEIDKISDSDSAPTNFRAVIEGNDILRLISYWNDKHESDNIIDSVIANLPSEASKKKEAFNNYVQPLVEQLLVKATDVASESCFDDNTIDALNDLTEDLRESKNKGVNDLTNLKTRFEKLYVMLRQMEALRINSEIQSRYSFLNDISSNDKDFVDEKLIVEDTKSDLEAEGLGSVSQSIANDIKITETDGIEDPDEDDELTPEQVERQVADLVNDNVLKETSVEYRGAKVYVESMKTGNRDHERVFIIKDNEIKELENAKISGGTLCYIDSSNRTVTEKTITANSIENAYKDAKRAQERSEEESSSRIEAERNGKKVWQTLNGWTSKADSNVIEDALGQVDKSNILSFLDGAYQQAGAHHEGLIEKLDDDTTLSMETKRNLINCLLDKAADMGMESDSAYLDLKELMHEHDIAHPGATNYNQYHHGWGAWIFGCHTNYKEEIDKLFEKLYHAMKAKAAGA